MSGLELFTISFVVVADIFTCFFHFRKPHLYCLPIHLCVQLWMTLGQPSNLKIYCSGDDPSCSSFLQISFAQNTSVMSHISVPILHAKLQNIADGLFRDSCWLKVLMPAITLDPGGLSCISTLPRRSITLFSPLKAQTRIVF